MRVVWHSLLCATTFLVSVDSAAAQPPDRGTTAPSVRGDPSLTVPPPAGQPAGPAGTNPAAAPTPAENPPALVSADQVVYNEAENKVVATGHVEIARGGRVVYAEQVVYDRKTQVVVATGNVRVFETSGEVIFADYAELTDDLAYAFVENVRVLLPDSSRLAANEGDRRAGEFLRLDHGIYTPCSLCRTDPSAPPVWQLRGARVLHDKEEQEIRYRDVTIDLLGVPVFYTPYLSHPDPTVDRKTGFMAPIVGGGSDLGSFVRNGYYLDLAPDMDATIYLTLFTSSNPLFGGEWRKRFENGRLDLNASVTQGEFTERSGTVDSNAIRGHFFADGLFEINDAWRWGGTVRTASDYTFLREYQRVSGDNHLTSRGFVEGFHGRNYTALSTYRFQSLLTQNDVDEPIVFPLAEHHALGEPGSLLGGHWSFDAGIRGISRDDGAESTRFSIEPGWHIRHVDANTGVVAGFDASIRGDLYNYGEFRNPNLPNRSQSDTIARIYPEAQISLRYPWVSLSEWGEVLLEPIVAYTAAPRADRDIPFPNEDSLDLEFSATNLFARNRFSGSDLVEGGQRAAYGLRTGFYGFGDYSAELLVGQRYSLTDPNVAPQGSGLETNWSDYVGQLDLRMTPWVDLTYGFRLDKSSLDPRLQVAQISAGPPALRMSASYTTIDQVAGGTVEGKQNREYISAGVSAQLSRYWSTAVSHSQALAPDPGPRATSLLLNYQDECLIFQSVVGRDYTTVRGVDNGTTVLFRLVFRNLGEFTSPTFSPSTLGGRKQGNTGTDTTTISTTGGS